MSIRKKLKFQLPIMTNKKYLRFIAANNPGMDLHHFTKGFKGKKHNDYLVYALSREDHNKVHQQGIEDEETAVLEIIKNLISYINHLEKL